MSVWPPQGRIEGSTLPSKTNTTKKGRKIGWEFTSKRRHCVWCVVILNNYTGRPEIKDKPAAGAEKAITTGQADLIAFGRPFLSNPDPVERFAKGWDLNPPADVKAWSAPDAAGYTDFPFHVRD